MTTLLKDPDGVLDYTFNWAAWLPDGDTIASAQVEASGVTVDTWAEDDTTVTVWLSGGDVGTRATVTCRVTTVQGRTDDRTLHLMIQER